MKRGALFAAAAALALATLPPLACDTSTIAVVHHQVHSGAMASSPDGSKLYVVHPDADSVSVLDVATRAIDREVLLAPTAPGVAANGRFDAAVAPRAVARDASGTRLFVTGERSGSLYLVDAGKGTVTASPPLCAEPVGVLVSPDDTKVFVACSEDDEVLEVDAKTLAVVAKAATPRKPWTLAFADTRTLLVTHLLGPGITKITLDPFAVATTWTIADRGPEVDPKEPHGLVRGIYDAVPRPGSAEIWSPHLMLGTDTPQPLLEFDNTVFPAVTILDASKDGVELARLSISQDTSRAGDGGAFGDIVSGPRAIAFSDDGALAFVVDTDSEDLLVVDARRRVEAAIVRPLPGHMPEGVVAIGDEVFVSERNTEDVVGYRVARHPDGTVTLAQDGGAWKTLAHDPMPAAMRLGQKLFYSANSDDVPITQNHWVACASCHIEGRSDAVTWLFEQGPRDTPSNAGGMLGTGFLFRTADRNEVQDYWKTIDVEQGGSFSRGGEQDPMLDAIATYVNYALPAAVPPTTDATLRAQGQIVFSRVGCAKCHAGPLATDSGAGNASLALDGAIALHDVGTCVTSGPWPDVSHFAIDGTPREACAFDTPALRGLVDSAPFFHDGSAATLDDAVGVMLRAAESPPISSDDEKALVEYLRSL